ncbi:MAG: DUF1015 domain-containing protein [Candidatus Marinimicrobia bacterium]|jgi:uncharacterized protein (DUF1015 family)|nr:DUF1015 domain-containing protein [Candidatus Neomarinimicrobiota bacterium]MDP6577760.1 DUF1015 domain-containing protein [Candidatus Neomarinimicrobiota bacterium]MDP7059630.1 DUF1015 domain-containing protein [Candidatus Neomarinimicrobiota bacterium]|tara:strand:+ start:2910 stop:4166 length:1257 start_codon:yes stop_codon:yes gene_type:complete
MVDIRPFKGFSYIPSNGSDLSSVIAPPYDVITDQERSDLASKSPHNFVHMTLPENYDSGRSDPDFYKEAASRWDSLKKNSTFEQSNSPAIWCLKETYEKNNGQPVTRFGFITELSLENESDRFVLRHEKTHKAPQMDRMKLYEATRSNLSPLFFIYQDDPNETKNFLEQFKTAESRTAEWDHHGKVYLELSSTENEDWIESFCQSFREKYVLIADGHHRYEASRIFHKKNIDDDLDTSAVMAYLVPASSPGLIVHATHRAVHGLVDFDETEFLKSLKDRFTFDAPQSGSNQIEVVTPAKGRFTVTPNEQTLKRLRKQYKSFDFSDLTVIILEEIVLREILGLSQRQTSSNGNLKYFQNANSAFESVNSGEWNTAFLLDQVPLNDLFSVTKAGGILPQKSTYFYPKVPTGLVVRSMERS